jgi:hypothetical protein
VQRAPPRQGLPRTAAAQRGKLVQWDDRDPLAEFPRPRSHLKVAKFVLQYIRSMAQSAGKTLQLTIVQTTPSRSFRPFPEDHVQARNSSFPLSRFRALSQPTTV